MKQKCWQFLLCLVMFSSSYIVHAQTGSDTTFSFYFNTAQYKTDYTQQKAFETFLKSIRNITAIRGYTDTVGTIAYNQTLAKQRALQIYQLLPPSFRNEKLIVVAGETAVFENRWQNRRVDVVGTKVSLPEAAQLEIKDSVKEELNIETILFLPDVAVLTEASYAYVKALAQQLQQYPTENFQIIGHVNYQSKLPPERLKDLYELSERRAKTVFDLLVEYGIDASRMTYKGVGNSKPIFAEPVNDEQKRANMRVQVLILRP